MDFDATFPLRYCMNLAKRQDRRLEYEEQFQLASLEVARFPSVNATLARHAHGYATAGRYAHALTVCLILRRAIRLKAEAVFIFEDDVILNPGFRDHLSEIKLPGDWGLFYLGGQHTEEPRVVAPGLVKATRVLDTHAWGCRAEHLTTIMQALRCVKPQLLPMKQPDGTIIKRRFRPAADQTIASLQSQIASYATYPNLAWQREEHSDLAEGSYSNYDHTGSQIWYRPQLRGVLAKSLGKRAFTPRTGAPAALPPEGKLAVLFLMVGEHADPQIWEEYCNGDRCSVFCHASQREGLGSWLCRHQIDETILTEWGDISLVRAQVALLKAALSDENNFFFLFASETCVPVRPLDDLMRLLEVDGRDRFHWLEFEDQLQQDRQKAERAYGCRTIPTHYWRFHSQWVLLSREAAVAVAEDDFTGHFEETFAPDESYFGTVLAAKGYPLEERVAKQDVTWKCWSRGGHSHPETFDEVTPSLAGEILGSGCYFARKFSPLSNIGEFQLHLPKSPHLPRSSR